MRRERIRVAMVDAVGFGGLTHYTYSLMRSLSAHAQVDCTLLTDTAYELDGLKRDFPVVKVSCRGQPYQNAAARLVKAIARLKPDCIHVQAGLTVRRDWLLFLLARSLRGRIILTAHNILPHDDWEKHAFGMRQALGIMYGCAAKVIVHSQYSKRKLTARFGVAPDTIAVIPHGNYLFVRMQEMTQAAARREIGIPAEKKVAMHFGAMRDYKGIDLLLKAFARLKERHEDAFLLLVGKSADKRPSDYEGLIRSLQIEKDVMLLPGYVPLKDIGQYFFAADLAVYPYREIDMSGSLQIAYAFGRPVIASRVGGFPEMVEDGRNGLLCEPEDIPALQESLEKMLFGGALLRKMGEESLRLAQGRFNWETIADTTLSVYEDVCR